MDEEKVNFLDTEEALQALIVEMKRLKKASQQIEEAKIKAEAVTSIGEEVLSGFKTFETKAYEVIKEISDAELKSQLDSLVKINKNILEGISQQNETQKKRTHITISLIIVGIAIQFVILLGVALNLFLR